MDFIVTLSNVLIALFFMVPGYLLRKFKLANENHLKTLSSVLIYVCGPGMVISAFLKTEYTNEKALSMLLFFIFSLVMQIIVLFLFYLVLRKKFTDAKYRIMTISSVFGNVGFFGMPLIRALIDDPIALCYSSMFVLSMNILVFTVGVYAITSEKKYISLKSAVLNPTFIAILVSIPLFIFSVDLPVVLDESIDLLGKMTMPVCMLILGIRLACIDIKSLFTNYFAYIIVSLKLILFPLFCYLLVYFLPLDVIFKQSVLILSSAPCASVILNLAEIHGKEQDLSANAILLSTILSTITIPVLLLIL